MKVGYIQLSGHPSKAYLDEEPDADGIYHGEDKHSGRPLRIRWNELTESWQEVES